MHASYRVVTDQHILHAISNSCMKWSNGCVCMNAYTHLAFKELNATHNNEVWVAIQLYVQGNNKMCLHPNCPTWGYDFSIYMARLHACHTVLHVGKCAAYDIQGAFLKKTCFTHDDHIVV